MEVLEDTTKFGDSPIHLNDCNGSLDSGDIIGGDGELN